VEKRWPEGNKAACVRRVVGNLAAAKTPCIDKLKRARTERPRGGDGHYEQRLAFSICRNSAGCAWRLDSLPQRPGDFSSRDNRPLRCKTQCVIRGAWECRATGWGRAVQIPTRPTIFISGSRQKSVSSSLFVAPKRYNSHYC